MSHFTAVFLDCCSYSQRMFSEGGKLLALFQGNVACLLGQTFTCRIAGNLFNLPQTLSQQTLS